MIQSYKRKLRQSGHVLQMQQDRPQRQTVQWEELDTEWKTGKPKKTATTPNVKI